MDIENGLGLHSGRPIYHVDICAGSGMLGLGLKLALGGRLRAIAVVERDARAAALIVERMEEAALDPAPLWDDVTTCRESEFVEFVRQFDPLLVSAGYPCQPWSSAGLRLGANDERHLWPFILDFMRVAVPRYVFLENVAGHLSLGFDVVLGDLQAAGYDVACGLFTAAEVGASHERKRLFALAVRNDSVGDPEGASRRLPDGRWRADDTNGTSGALEAGKSGKILADADGVRLQLAPRPGISEIEIGSQPVEPASKLCGLLLPARLDGGAAGAAGQLADPGGAGCEGSGGTEPLGQRNGQETSGPAPKLCNVLFAPGPDDVDVWRRILAEDPTLEPSICGTADGMAAGLVADRLRICGNGVVPLQAAYAFTILAAAHVARNEAPS